MTNPESTDLADQLQQLSGTPAEKTPEPVYRSLVEWVTDWLGQVVERRLRSGRISDGHTPTRWCPSWWTHPEVVSRLAALWHAWEALRLDAATGMSVWWRDHFDTHWPVLTGEHGPMSICGEEGGHIEALPPLPLNPPARDWKPPTD